VKSINQSINVKFVGRRYTTRPGAPTVVSDKHDSAFVALANLRYINALNNNNNKVHS